MTYDSGQINDYSHCYPGFKDKKIYKYVYVFTPEDDPQIIVHSFIGYDNITFLLFITKY